MAWWDDQPKNGDQPTRTPVFEVINLSPRWRARLRIKRLLAERWLDALGPPRSWRRGPSFVGLCYHAVIADDDRTSWYDPNLVTSVAFLRRQLSLLRRWFEPVLSTALIERLGLLPGEIPMALVTFDDGLRSVHDFGLGVMREHDIKATMFLNDSVIGGEGGLWHDSAAGSARLLTRDTVSRILAECGHPRGRAALSIIDDTLARRTVEALKEMAAPSLTCAVEALVTTSGYTPSRRRYLSAQEARSMFDAGHELGGHSTHHFILPLLDKVALLREISGNREALEAMFERPVSVFAYPNGDHGARERDALRDLGFAGAFEVEGDGSGGLWALPRRNACDLMCMDEKGQFSAALYFWTLLSPRRWIRRLGRAARRV